MPSRSVSPPPSNSVRRKVAEDILDPAESGEIVDHFFGAIVCEQAPFFGLDAKSRPSGGRADETDHRGPDPIMPPRGSRGACRFSVLPLDHSLGLM
jgi:hypothetical protein